MTTLIDCSIVDLIEMLRCGICYTDVSNNVTQCCKQKICKNCYMSLIDQNREKTGINKGKCLKDISCPYCRNAKLYLKY